MSTKGQLTVFFMVGILLLAAAMFIPFVNNPELQYAIEITEDDVEVQIWVDECIQEAIFDSLYLFSSSQGFHTQPVDSLQHGILSTAYYVLFEKSIMPSNDFFEQELNKIAQEEITGLCSDFSLFEDQGYDISHKKPEVTSYIENDHVLFDITYPITVSKGDRRITVSTFSYDAPFRIGLILETIRDLIDFIVESPSVINYNALKNQDVAIIVEGYDACTHIYTIFDTQSGYEEYPLRYSFAVKFSQDYCAFDTFEEDLV